MIIKLEIYDALPCQAREFEINGIKAQIDWFVENENDCECEDECSNQYSCCNRRTEKLDIEEVRKQLPLPLKDLNDSQIREIQERLSDELISGSCGWCE